MEFQDEMRIGQRGTHTRIWKLRGTRHGRAARQSESGYIFDAKYAQGDAAVSLMLLFANTNTMTLHL